uniref:TRAM domain-containing protein n=1 Tax=Heterorhabditis bacteriophora TaxID=37862 RepID=A0A1I7XB71_HETBA
MRGSPSLDRRTPQSIAAVGMDMPQLYSASLILMLYWFAMHSSLLLCSSAHIVMVLISNTLLKWDENVVLRKSFQRLKNQMHTFYLRIFPVREEKVLHFEKIRFGCMAERVRHDLLSKNGLVDVVAGRETSNTSGSELKLFVLFSQIVTISTIKKIHSLVHHVTCRPRLGGRTFLTLLDKVSEIDPEMRIRFTSPHPKDFPMEVINIIKERKNICNQLHLPAQSGDNKVLDTMGRGYTRELYLQLVNDIRAILPDVYLTSDFISGFCGESEEAHQMTLNLIRQVKYSFCYVFPYSMREKTHAHYHLLDNVPVDIKRQRHEELASVFREEALKLHRKLIGTTQLVLVEGVGRLCYFRQSKRSETAVQGRADGGTKVIFENNGNYEPGDYVAVKVTIVHLYNISCCLCI